MRVVLPKDWKDGAPTTDKVKVFFGGQQIKGIQNFAFVFSPYDSVAQISLQFVPIDGLIVEHETEEDEHKASDGPESTKRAPDTETAVWI